MPLEGVDVSHNNGTVVWRRVKAAGISFAYIKATEGVTWVDPAWSKNLAGCRTVGIAPGMYHFYRHDADAQKQAVHFVNTVGEHTEGDLPPALDIEAPGDGAGPISYDTAEVVRRIGEFVHVVEHAMGRAPLIYTYPAVWRELTGDSTAFSGTCQLWIASYNPSPAIPGNWTNYAVWQYTDRGHVDGIATIVDRDRMSDGDVALDELRHRTLELAGLAITTQNANVRRAPGLTSHIIKVLPRGTGVALVAGPEVVKDRQWWEVDDGQGTVGWCSGKLLKPA